MADIIVTSVSRSLGRLTVDGRVYTCALGRAGLSRSKREGDGATPVGRFPLRYLLYRADRQERPVTSLPVKIIQPQDGWCDDPAAPEYNRPVALPHPARHERLWRDDEVYDLIVVLGHNDSPPVAGLGSAIFMHIARPGFEPTEGCVALKRADLIEFLACVSPAAAIEIKD